MYEVKECSYGILMSNFGIEEIKQNRHKHQKTGCKKGGDQNMMFFLFYFLWRGFYFIIKSCILVYFLIQTYPWSLQN